MERRYDKMLTNYLERKKDKIRVWAERSAARPNSKRWLALISFIESSFFPIPPDFLLIALLTTNERRRWFQYSLITTVASVLGGLVAYGLGYLFFHAVGAQVVAFYHLEARITAMQTLFATNAFAAIVFAAFMPIPEAYKVGALASGIFHINPLIFIAASVLGRGARFFLVGIFMRLFGERLTAFIYKHFTLVFYLVIVLALGIIAFLIF